MGKDAVRDVRSLGLAIPQFGKATITLDLTMVLEFGPSEKLAVDFSGSWDRYKRIKSVTDALGQEASTASVRMVLRADFEDGLDASGDQYHTIRDVLAQLDMGRITVESEPMPE